ncbi:Signal-transduction histidine kinase senX3 [Planctomycetes bacterium CA13]|uniref:histidine kinase n=1 Tax=Novipirellula herctigrandis TaxID=2527986 RepID=A0A5C5Z5E3_9BACT|nr:Signal-transduction histidine kinase senX3 [Planctomycetes bacterium CA13]
MNNDRLAWPIVLLLLTVLVPSVGVVWMMREAVRNERLASDQRLMEAYQMQLQTAVETVQDRWADQIRRSSETVQQHAPATAFAEIVLQGDLDAVLIRDGQGNITYPNPTPSSPIRTNVTVRSEETEPLWTRAQRLEFVDRKFAEAAEIYSQLSIESSDAILQGRCRQAQVRCLLELDRDDLAIKVLQTQRKRPQLRDWEGRSFAAAAEMRLLELMDEDSSQWQEVATSLTLRLNDYRDDKLTSSQRLFLMNQFGHLTSESMDWPTYAAETLANQAALVEEIQHASPRLQETAIPDVWCRATPDGRIVELYRTATLDRRLRELADGLPLPRGVTFVLTPPNKVSDNLMDASLNSQFGGWRLGLAMTQGDLRNQISQERRAIHGWIALLVVAVTCVLGWLLSDALRRRLRLAKLKNDLVTTVSHELKTPLASIRLLVDTLLHDEHEPKSETATVQRREYLQLISLENARLTRMIDNFLTFSRIERGKPGVEFQRVDMRDVVDQAATIFREHTGDVDDSLHIDRAQSAMVSGDSDSLVTAVVNLLENAWKYSDAPRQITVTTDVSDERVTVAVRDNGIGMNARAISQAFDRFFQVDQHVSRTRGGCGLGLSIVRAIMLSHGGEVQVVSEPDVGSTFTLSLPKPVEVLP